MEPAGRTKLSIQTKLLHTTAALIEQCLRKMRTALFAAVVRGIRIDVSTLRAGHINAKRSSLGKSVQITDQLVDTAVAIIGFLGHAARYDAPILCTSPFDLCGVVVQMFLTVFVTRRTVKR